MRKVFISFELKTETTACYYPEQKQLDVLRTYPRMLLLLNKYSQKFNLLSDLLVTSNYTSSPCHREFPTLLECFVTDTIPRLSSPRPLKCFMAINSYNTLERKRGVISCTSQMKRPEAGRLNGLPTSDRAASIPARTGAKEVTVFSTRAGKNLL